MTAEDDPADRDLASESVASHRVDLDEEAATADLVEQSVAAEPESGSDRPDVDVEASEADVIEQSMTIGDEPA